MASRSSSGLGGVFERYAHVQPDLPAVVDLEGQWSYKETMGDPMDLRAMGAGQLWDKQGPGNTTWKETAVKKQFGWALVSHVASEEI